MVYFLRSEGHSGVCNSENEVLMIIVQLSYCLYTLLFHASKGYLPASRDEVAGDVPGRLTAGEVPGQQETPPEPDTGIFILLVRPSCLLDSSTS